VGIRRMMRTKWILREGVYICIAVALGVPLEVVEQKLIYGAHDIMLSL
jgi:hypothetical protein